MDIPWEDIRLFLAVAQAGSLSGAAKRLHLAQPTVTRRVAELEDRLGAKLFHRSVSGARLSATGERLVIFAEQMAKWATEVSRTAAARDNTPHGLVRVTAMPFMAARWFAPFAAWVLQKHPNLRLEVLSSVRHLDLARGEADLALRLRKATDSDLITLAEFPVEHAVMATPQLAARLRPIQDLRQIPWVAWAPPHEDLSPNVQLNELIPGFVPAFTSDSYLVLLAAAQAGVGVIVLPKLQHARLPDLGLVELALDLGPYQRGISYLVAAKSALNIHRVRIVAHMLEKELRRATSP